MSISETPIVDIKYPDGYDIEVIKDAYNIRLLSYHIIKSDNKTVILNSRVVFHDDCLFELDLNLHEKYYLPDDTCIYSDELDVINPVLETVLTEILKTVCDIFFTGAGKIFVNFRKTINAIKIKGIWENIDSTYLKKMLLENLNRLKVGTRL